MAFRVAGETQGLQAPKAAEGTMDLQDLRVLLDVQENRGLRAM